MVDSGWEYPHKLRLGHIEELIDHFDNDVGNNL